MLTCTIVLNQDAEWAAREEARQRLMAEVESIRRQQIAEKQERR